MLPGRYGVSMPLTLRNGRDAAHPGNHSLAAVDPWSRPFDRIVRVRQLRGLLLEPLAACVAGLLTVVGGPGAINRQLAERGWQPFSRDRF